MLTASSQNKSFHITYEENVEKIDPGFAKFTTITMNSKLRSLLDT